MTISKPTEVRVERASFVFNVAEIGGAVALTAAGAQPTYFYDCAFESNDATDGGAVYMSTNEGQEVVYNCTFYGNHAGEIMGATGRSLRKGIEPVSQHRHRRVEGHPSRATQHRLGRQMGSGSRPVPLPILPDQTAFSKAAECCATDSPTSLSANRSRITQDVAEKQPPEPCAHHPFPSFFSEISGGAIFHTGYLGMYFTDFVANEAGQDGMAVFSVGLVEEALNVTFDSNTLSCPVGEYGYDEEVRPLKAAGVAWVL